MLIKGSDPEDSEHPLTFLLAYKVFPFLWIVFGWLTPNSVSQLKAPQCFGWFNYKIQKIRAVKSIRIYDDITRVIISVELQTKCSFIQRSKTIKLNLNSIADRQMMLYKRSLTIRPNGHFVPLHYSAWHYVRAGCFLLGRDCTQLKPVSSERCVPPFNAVYGTQNGCSRWIKGRANILKYMLKFKFEVFYCKLSH